MHEQCKYFCSISQAVNTIVIKKAHCYDVVNDDSDEDYTNYYIMIP